LSKITALKHFVIAVVMIMGTMGFHAALAQNEVPCTPEWGAEPDRAQEAYTLYREFMKQGNYKGALPYLKTLIDLAPGARQTTYVDGVYIYKDLLSKSTDAAQKQEYVNTILKMYDGRIRCFGAGYGRKAYDMYSLTPANVSGTLKAFDTALEKEGDKIEDLLLFPYMITVEKSLIKGELDTIAMVNRYMKVVELVERNAASNKAAKYNAALAQITERMGPFLSCEVIKPILRKQYDANPNDTVVIGKLFKQFYSLRCTSDPLFLEVAEKLLLQKPSESIYRILYYSANNDGKYDEAMTYANKALELASDNESKAKYHLEIAKIQQRNGDFSSARASAIKSVQLKPSGNPYLLIGDLYRASGKLCSSGAGFESQVIVWVALDMYEKAKSIDPSVTAEANKKITDAKQDMPAKGECFFRNLKDGDAFKVGCWINETTIVRCLND
jgi:tetratricopeptide (TPR) repeat protein